MAPEDQEPEDSAIEPDEDGSIKRQGPAIDEQAEGTSDEEHAPESCDTEKEVGDRAVQRMLLVLFLLYPSLSTTCFKFFSCRMLDSGEIYHVDDMTVDCASSSHLGCLAKKAGDARSSCHPHHHLPTPFPLTYNPCTYTRRPPLFFAVSY